MGKKSSSATRQERRTLIAVVLLATLVFVVDVALPLGVASGVLHVGVVLVALRASSERMVIGTAAVCSVLVLLDMLVSTGPGNTEWWKVSVNRGMSIFVIWVTALLGLQRNRAAEAQRRHLSELAHLGRLKTVECLSGALAHELNQPLAAVALQAEVARQKLADHGAGGEFDTALREIAEQSQRASDIVRALRSLVRRAESERKAVPLNDLVEDALRLIQPTARQADIELRVQTSADGPIVNVDPVQIEQVLLNLMQNAAEVLAASPSQLRRITLTTHNSGPREVQVEISDSGPGITPELVDRLFDPFYSSKSQGLGLGLTISQSIIEAHGGRLWLASSGSRSGTTSTGLGTTFAFVLPTE